MRRSTQPGPISTGYRATSPSWMRISPIRYGDSVSTPHRRKTCSWAPEDSPTPPRWRGGDQLAIIAGPCVVESLEINLRHAERLAKISLKSGVSIVFKSSFDKANRTSHSSFRGPGLEEGLEILARIKRETNLPLLTDIHEPHQAAAAAGVVDILQIPALLSRQTDLITAAARTDAVVNLKKGQFLAPWEMKAVVAKAESAGSRRIIVTERGFSFGYNNLVSDMRSLVIMRGFGYPVVFDATHSVQLPGAGGERSGGQREFVAPLARGRSRSVSTRFSWRCMKILIMRSATVRIRIRSSWCRR